MIQFFRSVSAPHDQDDDDDSINIDDEDDDDFLPINPFCRPVTAPLQ